MNCVMCHEEFGVADLDFLGRCMVCFRVYVTTPVEDRPHLGVPYTPVSKAVK